MTQVDNPEKTSTSVGKPSADDTFLTLMRKRLDRSVTNESDERKKGQNDTKFINGEQWEESIKQQRGKNRLCITINKLPTFLDQIDGDIRLNTPGLKIKAVDNDADPETADVIEGLVRYIQRNSRSTRIHAYAGVHLAAGGRGAWRILTEYAGDNSFEQEIRIARIINAYSVYFDPAAEQDDKQDGMYMFLVTDMSKDEYKDQYDHEPVDFAIDGSEFVNWQTESTVKIAEYFYKEKVEEKTIYLLKNGKVTTKKPKKGKAERTRTVPIYKIKWAKVDGKRVLETGDIPGNMFPIVIVWGKQLCIDGKIESRGIARHAKDACMLYNYFRTNDAEAAALQPKQPYMMPDVCLGNFKDVWDKSNDENYPYLPYKVDPTNPSLKPYREAPAMASSANQVQIQIADGEMLDTVGIQKAALGKEGKEKSGIAIHRLKQESDTGQYAFLDNLSAGICTEGKIVVGMIPEIYDVEKQIRILGKDMKEKIVSINDGAGIDLTTGKYDVDISTGGSYSTQREEFQERLEGIMPHLVPEQVAVIADIVFEMQDFPRADDIAARLRKLIPPEILEGDEEGGTMEAGEGGIPGAEGLSPEGGGEPPPDPVMEAEMERLRMENEKGDVELQITQTKLEQEEVKLEGLRIDNDLKVKASKEEIEAMVRKMLADLGSGAAKPGAVI